MCFIADHATMNLAQNCRTLSVLHNVRAIIFAANSHEYEFFPTVFVWLFFCLFNVFIKPIQQTMKIFMQIVQHIFHEYF